MTTQHIGTDRQLFVDHHWIAQSRDVDRVLHEPTRREVAIAKEYPWEQGYVGGLMTAFDGEKYRMWYTCDEAAALGIPGFPSYRLRAYAESEDGINWTKPFLHKEEFEGSKENNLFARGDRVVVNIDKNPEAKEEERFKAFQVMGRGEESGIYAMASPDGIDWHQMHEKPILTGRPFDAKNLFFWDEWTEQYRGYTRGRIGVGTPEKAEHDNGSWQDAYRWMRTSTSQDFHEWTPLVNIDAGDTPFEDLYSNECWPYERAPGTYLMFPSRFIPQRVPDPDWFDGSGLSDIVFLSSRDGFHFDRSFMEGFIRPGLDRNNWHERAIYAQYGVYQTSPDELSMYVCEFSKSPACEIRRYTLRPDGFVSVNGGYDGGEFTTKPMTFDGSLLELNYSTSAVGTVKIEIQDDKGNALPGYGLDDCPEMFGDEIDGVVRWEGGSDVSSLAGKPVRLRLQLSDADVYAFKFNK